MPRELFLSFSSHDQDAATLIVDDVERHTGWRFFQCSRPDDNPVGGDWTAALANHLSDCLAMVLVHSAHARTSRYVHREIEMAVAIEKPIIAIRLDDAGWGPGVDYLMRTIQAPVVLRRDLPVYLPHLRRAIARVLPSALALPLDSIADRQLKVEAVRHMACKVAPKSGGARMHGLAVKLEGLDDLFVASPCVASRAWDDLCTSLRQSADFELGEDGGFALLPILSKEDIVQLVLVTAATRSEIACQVTMAGLRDGIVADLQGRGITPTVKEGMLALDDPSGGGSFERIAEWLTALAKDTRAPATPVPEAATIPSGNPEVLREALRTLVRTVEPPPRTLPLALTGVAAWRQFEATGILERSLA